MNKQRALFIALETLHAPGLPGRQLRLPPSIHRLVADYAAMGYAIIPVAASQKYGLATRTSRELLMTEVTTLIRKATGVVAPNVLLLDNPFDPKEVWDTARRFSLDIRGSMLMTQGGLYAGLFRTAGVGRITTVGELSRVLAVA